MQTYQLHIKLLSDTTFGRGDGIAGLIDQEIEHDQHGFPFLRGRSLKGLLSEECDTLLKSLGSAGEPLIAARNILFGIGGSQLDTQSCLRFGDARLPAQLRQQLQAANISAHEILTALTVIRRQTALADGVAQRGSLRSSRAVVRKLTFVSEITAVKNLTKQQQALLTASCKALRRLGSDRNRGRGRVDCWLIDTANPSTPLTLDELASALGV